MLDELLTANSGSDLIKIGQRISLRLPPRKKPPTPVVVGISICNGDSCANNLFERIAKSGASEFRSVESGQEMINFLKEVTSKNCCIQKLTFAGHGWGSRIDKIYRGPGIPGVGPGSGGLYIDEHKHDTAGASLSDLSEEVRSGRIRFCKPCVIQIHSCRISEDFVKGLARVTGCQVIAASSSCFPDTENPALWRSAPGTFYERGSYNGFWSSNAGSEVEKIGNTHDPR